MLSSQTDFAQLYRSLLYNILAVPHTRRYAPETYSISCSLSNCAVDYTLAVPALAQCDWKQVERNLQSMQEHPCHWWYSREAVWSCNQQTMHSLQKCALNCMKQTQCAADIASQTAPVARLSYGTAQNPYKNKTALNPKYRDCIFCKCDPSSMTMLSNGHAG